VATGISVAEETAMKRDSPETRFPKADERVPALLIVEDEVLIRLSVADYLRDCGFKVFEAADAREALDILATETAVDLVFSDVALPGGMDGFALAQKIRVERPGLPVVLASGDSRKAAIARDLCENEPFFAKPYDIEQVVRHIRALITSRKTEAGEQARPMHRAGRRVR
jgi:CheY-like chemotaxis protein